MDIMKILGNIGFDWPVALANFFNFLIIFFILKKFAFKPIQKIIAERQARIAEGLAYAKEAETARTMAEEEKRRITAAARAEANEIVGDAKKKAVALIAKGKEDAALAAEQVMADSRGKMAAEREQMERDARNALVGVMTQGIEAVLREDTDRSVYEKRIRNILAR